MVFLIVSFLEIYNFVFVKNTFLYTQIKPFSFFCVNFCML